MIALLTGRLDRKSTDYLIVNVGGVGYQVHVPLSTYCSIPDAGEITLHIYTHLREDTLSLFGFLTQEEKDVFLLLMGVSGIGPKSALAVLSSLSVYDIVSAVRDGDDARLCTIPGIGRKTAARIILELKDSVKRISNASWQGATRDEAGHDDFSDAVSALVNLGYKQSVAEDAMKKVRERHSGLAVQGLIREALNILMRR